MEPRENVKAFNAEARVRLLVDAITDYAIYMLDPDGIVVSWNAGAQRLKGYTEQEIVGQHFSVFHREEDVAAGLPGRALQEAEREGRFESEGWRRDKNGRQFWAHAAIDAIRSPDGALLGFAKVTRDLSERRVAEDALRRSEEQFRLLVQGVTDYAIYMLDPGGVITNWNPGAQRIKGYAPDEVIGSHFSRFYVSEDRERGEPQRALATAEREGRFESEGWRQRKDGTRFWANVVVDPIRDAGGRLIGFAKVTRDVTDKREAQLELERARETLFQAQKLDAIGQLTGGVAHDFNNLLMVIMSSLALLRRQMPDDARLRRLVDNAMDGARRGASLTQRMLAFARRQALNPSAVDLPALARGMSDMLARTLGSSIQIAFEMAPSLPAVLVDANQLELAMLNLAVNGRDAMPAGGRLTIAAAEATVAAGDARLRAGRYVRLAVTDSGQGMDPLTLSRATEPFFTTKGTGKGTGLGLPMVHGLAAQSGGHFVLESVVGAGTTATLWLPVAPPAEARALEPLLAEPRLAERQRPQVILAVDDDSLVLTGTVALLEDLGHVVMAAGSAREALEVLAREPSVTLVITDHVMPAMTGADLVQRLKADRPELPTILVTGFGDLSPDLGSITRILAKPFDQTTLAAAIVEVSNRRAASAPGKALPTAAPASPA